MFALQTFCSRLHLTMNWPWRSSKTFIMLTICVATFTDGVIYGIIVPALPFILREHTLTPVDQLQLYTSLLAGAFSLSDLITAPFCAWIVDRFSSRRIPWFSGIFLITFGTILFGISNKFPLLLVSRLLQGASSAILYTVGLAVLVDTVDRDEVGKWMGTAMSCNNIGMIISPLLGGIVYDKSGKMSVFAIMISLGGLDIALRVLMQERGKNKSTAPSNDGENSANQSILHAKDFSNKNIPGTKDQPEKGKSTTVTVSELSLPTALTTDTRPTTPLSIATTAIPPAPTNFPTATRSPMAYESRFPGILLLLKRARFLTAVYGCFINELIVASLLSILPLFVNKTFGWTSLQAGLLFLTIAIPAFAGPLAGWLADRLGPRWVAFAGFVLTTPSLVLLRLVERNERDQMVLLAGLLALAGCTIIFFLSPLGADVSFVAEEVGVEVYGTEDVLYASSFSIMNTALALAGLVGPLVGAWVDETVGWKGVTIVLGAFCFSGAVPCAFFIGSRPAKATSDTATYA